jgi:hypothetical protein
MVVDDIEGDSPSKESRGKSFQSFPPNAVASLVRDRPLQRSL